MATATGVGEAGMAELATEVEVTGTVDAKSSLYIRINKLVSKLTRIPHYFLRE